MTDPRRPSPQTIAEQESQQRRSHTVQSEDELRSQERVKSQERSLSGERLQSLERLQRLQSEEMALRNLLLTVSEYTRSDIEHLLQLVREEIDREREQMKTE